jgi:hypothetical protein
VLAFGPVSGTFFCHRERHSGVEASRFLLEGPEVKAYEQGGDQRHLGVAAPSLFTREPPTPRR